MKKIVPFLAVACLASFAAPSVAAEAAKPAAAPAAPAAEQPAEPPAIKVGEMVPEFKLKNAITGEMAEFPKVLKDTEKINAIVFMNTGCSSCLAEMSVISGLVKEYGAKLKVYAIAVDKRGEVVVKEYHDQYKFDVSYLIDPEFSIPPRFGFDYTPAMVVADKSGKVVMLKGGYSARRDSAKLVADIKALLK